MPKFCGGLSPKSPALNSTRSPGFIARSLGHHARSQRLKERTQLAHTAPRAGSQAWPTATDSESVHLGVPRFESVPAHTLRRSGATAQARTSAELRFVASAT